MRKILIGCVVSSLCFGAFAEFRIWIDRDGNEIEAEFVREMFDKVTLIKKDGTEIRMGITEFSDLDQKYFRVMVPPECEFDVKTVDYIKPKAWEEHPTTDEAIITKENITIKKVSKRPFTSRLYAEVFLIAEEFDGDNFILLSHEEFNFIFPEGGRTSYLYKTQPVETETYKQKGGPTFWRGETYAGYVILLKDAQNNLIKIETNTGEDWLTDPEVMQNLRNLMERGAASKRSRHFDKTGNKAEVPRVKYYMPSE